MLSVGAMCMCALAIGLILCGELVHEVSYSCVSETLARTSQALGVLLLGGFGGRAYLSIVPVDSSHPGGKWGAQRLLFHALSWGAFLVSCTLFFSLALWWKFICEQAWGLIPSVTTLLLLSLVFLISSVAAEEVDINSAVRYLRVNAFFLINIILVAAAAGLGVLAEINWTNRRNARAALVESILSVSFVVTALFNTHGVGGKLANKNWSFWNPFVGGVRFVLLQFFSWLLFSVSVVLSLLFIVSFYTVGLELFLGVTVISGIFCMLAELLMILSLHVYEDGERVSPATPSAVQEVVARVHATHVFLVTVVMVNIQYIAFASIYPLFLLAGMSVARAATHWWVACVAISLFTIVYLFFKTIDSSSTKPPSKTYTRLKRVSLVVVQLVPLALTLLLYLHAPAIQAVSPWCLISLLHVLYISGSYDRNPETTGCRELLRSDKLWPWLHHLDRLVQTYFSGSVVRETELSPDSLYVFGFHPHGVLPVSLFWLRNSEDWSRLFPGIVFSVLTASSLHLVPFMRDLLQWKGGREVSRDSFAYSLAQGRNVLVVPGGQTELMLSRSNEKEVRMTCKHTGFIRMAMAHGATLVPVFSFGENDVLDNVRIPWLQRWFIKCLGSALPFHPHSDYFLPVPRKQCITIVVGNPVSVERVSNPTPEQLDDVLSRYLEEIVRIFEKHKNSLYELKDRELVIMDAHNRPYSARSVCNAVDK